MRAPAAGRLWAAAQAQRARCVLSSLATPPGSGALPPHPPTAARTPTRQCYPRRRRGHRVCPRRGCGRQRRRRRRPHPRRRRCGMRHFGGLRATIHDTTTHKRRGHCTGIPDKTQRDTNPPTPRARARRARTHVGVRVHPVTRCARARASRSAPAAPRGRTPPHSRGRGCPTARGCRPGRGGRGRCARTAPGHLSVRAER